MNKIIKIKIFIIPVILLCFLVFADNTFAKSNSLGPNAAILKMSPKHPSPGDNVRLSLYATSFDIDTSLITWFINGEVVQQAYSVPTYNITVGDVGSAIVVDIRIEEGNKIATAKKIIRISDIDIAWEGVTYTPPFYEGRSLASQGSNINMVAIPKVVNNNGVFYDKDDLSYIWTINYSRVPYARGKGKHSINIENKKPFSDFIINLQVKDPTGEVRAVKKITIPNSQPKLLLYENNPLIGINYDSAIKKIYGVYGKDVTLIAEPYFMSATSRTDKVLGYSWSISGTKYTTPGSITFGPDPESQASGTAPLKLVVQNSKFWLQNARSDVQIEFGQKAEWGDNIKSETPAL